MIWRATKHEIDLTSRALVMGILNVTVDSFSDGGKYHSVENAVSRALQMADEGADIIDVGGESTRPGAEPVSVELEMERVLPVIGAIADSGTMSAERSGHANGVPVQHGSDDRRVFVSVDTCKAVVARSAVARGACIINDITGLQGDPEMIDVARETGAAIIIMHIKGTPRTMQDAPSYGDVTAEVREFFRQSLEFAVSSGIDPMCIAFDPGIGFGKSVAHNLTLLKNLADLRVGGRPLVVGVSRKSFIGRVIGELVPQDRDVATAVLAGLLRERGADVIRVHNVQQNVGALRITEAVLGAP